MTPLQNTEGVRPKRCLGRIRLSRLTDETTAPERQREIIENWAQAAGYMIVGWAIDLDVSGSIDPFSTPQLGDWLKNRYPEFDAVVAYRLDRFGRNAIRLNKLFEWCIDKGKTLVSVTESIDLSTWSGRMVASVIACLAEGELEAIKERTVDSRRKLRAVGRWPGGKLPFGYMSVKRLDEAGYGLEIDPVTAPLIRRIILDTIDGKPYSRIADELNNEGIITATDYFLARSAGSPTIYRTELPEGPNYMAERPDGTTYMRMWHMNTVRALVCGTALRGYVSHGGDVVRGDDGMPIKYGPELISDDEWELVQAEAARRAETTIGMQKRTLGPLSGVVKCMNCGESHRYTTTNRKYKYYRCFSAKCRAQGPIWNIKAAFLETIVQDFVLGEIGELQFMERIWSPGDSNSAELKQAQEGLDDLVIMAGSLKSVAARERLEGQIRALDTRISYLESQPTREAGWEYRANGSTFGEMWGHADVAGRRELLLKSGITMTARVIGVVGNRPGVKNRSSADNPGTLEGVIRYPRKLLENLGHPEGERSPWAEVRFKMPNPTQRQSSEGAMWKLAEFASTDTPVRLLAQM